MSLLENMSVLIKNPNLLLKFVLRQRNLAKFLDLKTREVRNYLKEADKITKRMLLLTRGLDKTGTMLSPLRGPVLYTCVRALKPEVMVETGVASGSSTYYILYAMDLNKKGVLYSIDLPNISSGALVPKGKEVGWLVPQELRYKWKLILGRSQEKLLPLLKALGSIDAFLHDSEHTYETMMFEYETAWSYLKKGGILLSDDVHWNSAFRDFVRKKRPRRWIVFDGLGAAMK